MHDYKNVGGLNLAHFLAMLTLDSFAHIHFDQSLYKICPLETQESLIYFNWVNNKCILNQFRKCIFKKLIINNT